MNILEEIAQHGDQGPLPAQIPAAVSNPPALSIVIPAYNESLRIGATLDHLIRYLKSEGLHAEIIVVDDGSDDATAAVALERAGSGVPLEVVRVHENHGKGFAVREGMYLHAKGRVRLFYDADGSTPIEDLARVWPEIEGGSAVVIGSRAHPDSQIERRQRWLREGLGRLNNLLLRKLEVTQFKDTQCGFKVFTAEACNVVFPRQWLHRFSFDAELLYIAEKHRLRIAEIPVRWRNDPSSRVNPVSDSVRMLVDNLRIRLHDKLGHYD